MRAGSGEASFSLSTCRRCAVQVTELDGPRSSPPPGKYSQRGRTLAGAVCAGHPRPSALHAGSPGRVIVRWQRTGRGRLAAAGLRRFAPARSGVSQQIDVADERLQTPGSDAPIAALLPSWGISLSRHGRAGSHPTRCRSTRQRRRCRRGDRSPCWPGTWLRVARP